MDFNEMRNKALEVRGLFEAYEKSKFGREWTREEIAMGMMVDLGDFVRLAMAKSGIRHAENLDERMEHELSDLMWSILVLAEKYDIDISSVFSRAMDELKISLTEKLNTQQVAAGNDR